MKNIIQLVKIFLSVLESEGILQNFISTNYNLAKSTWDRVGGLQENGKMEATDVVELSALIKDFLS